MVQYDIVPYMFLKYNKYYKYIWYPCNFYFNKIINAKVPIIEWQLLLRCLKTLKKFFTFSSNYISVNTTWRYVLQRVCCKLYVECNQNFENYYILV